MLVLIVENENAIEHFTMQFGYEKLEVSKLARGLIREVYLITKNFPDDEKYGLISQLRRAVASVLLNIAEGSNEESKKEFKYFVRISISSLVEVDCGLKIAIDLNYMKIEKYSELDPKIKELYFKLIGLAKYLAK